MNDSKFAKLYGEYIDLITEYNLGAPGLGNPKIRFTFTENEIARMAFEYALVYAECEGCFCTGGKLFNNALYCNCKKHHGNKE